MINNSADYAFVDFAAGDLPTGLFNGNIMPLRDDMPKDILKAEDIAFLIECVRDKIGAFGDISMPSYNGGYVPSSPFLRQTPTTKTVVPTKTISATQMRAIRTTCTNAITRGFATSNYGFLSSPLTEISTIATFSGGFNMLQQSHDIVAGRFGGTWAATSTNADFQSGSPVVRAPVRAIFDDAMHLVMPIFTLGRFGGPFADAQQFVTTHIQTGDAYNPPDGWYGYRVDQPSTSPSSIYVARGNFRAPSLTVQCSKQFISSARVWLLYLARNSVGLRDGSPSTSEFKSGLLRLSDLLTPAQDADNYYWAIEPSAGLSLQEKILQNCGWQLYSPSEAYEQQFYPLYDCELILEGVPNGRTQWW